MNARCPYAVSAHVMTDVGCHRESNEDCGQIIHPADPAILDGRGVLVMVADGMGGHRAGEVASLLAVEVIGRDYYESCDPPHTALQLAFQKANREIRSFSESHESFRGMGSTCTAMVIHDGLAFAAHVGDTRLYLIRGGVIQCKTEDHSAVMQMLKQGLLTEQQARNHADKNVILRALGGQPEVDVAIWTEPLRVEPGDRFLLCSDGLHDLVTDEEIRDVVLSSADLLASCEQLISLAKRRGGHDNITLAIVNIS
jgi:protein phosphatase